MDPNVEMLTLWCEELYYMFYVNLSSSNEEVECRNAHLNYADYKFAVEKVKHYVKLIGPEKVNLHTFYICPIARHNIIEEIYYDSIDTF